MSSSNISTISADTITCILRRAQNKVENLQEAIALANPPEVSAH